jgi:hypothetical protein
VLPLDLKTLYENFKTWYDDNAAWIGLLSVILAIVAIPLALWARRRPYRSKLLACERISGYSLVQVPANQRGKHPLKLVYGSEDVTAPYITVLRVGNLGSEEVKADEFDDPITIDFPRGKLLAYDVIDKSKPKIKPILTEDRDHSNRITLEPLLLNGHEWIDIQCVTDGDPGIPEVQSRVAGETKTMVGMMDRAEKSRRHLVWSALFVVLGVFGLIGISMLTTEQFPDQDILPLLAFGGGYLFGSIPFLEQVEMRKHRSWEKKQT